MKCDKSWPACLRCLSTDRICDGYGVWGGGGNLLPTRVDCDTHLETTPTSELGSPCVALQLYDLAPEENAYIDWYVNCTAQKFSGLFPSGFWDKAMLQASSSEPAALHALLTLSSAHKKEAQGGGSQEEAFTLSQYNLASRLLRGRISDHSHAVSELTLLVCVAFIQLECTRENLEAATLHLRHGMMLINQVHAATSDDWIVRAMRSYFIQAKLIGLEIEIPWPSRLISCIKPSFSSSLDARHDLERLLLHLIALENETEVVKILERIECIRHELAAWHEKYLAVDQVSYGLIDRFAFQLLHVHWILANVMLAYYVGQESALDKETRRFEDIVLESIELFKKAFSPGMETVRVRRGLEKAHSIADIGWIAPLFYTAIKCRIHRLRVQATRLFGCVDHREGLCPAGLLAIVARQVQNIEERSVFDKARDDFPLLSLPSEEELSRPKLPEKWRIHKVRIKLPEDPTGQIALACIRLDHDRKQSVWSGCYDLTLKHWTTS